MARRRKAMPLNLTEAEQIAWKNAEDAEMRAIESAKTAALLEPHLKRIAERPPVTTASINEAATAAANDARHDHEVFIETPAFRRDAKGKDWDRKRLKDY